MKLKRFFAILFISVILGGCGQAGSDDEASLKDNEDENIKELVNNYSSGNHDDGSASITSKQLFVKTSDGKELVYDVSGEDFFVSIAPYVNQTHP